MKKHRFICSCILALSAVAGCAQQPTAGPADAAQAGPAAGASQAVRMQEAVLVPALYQVAYSPRQKAVFVASAGAHDKPDEHPPRVLRVDPQTLAVQASIPMDMRSFGIALDDAADRLYVGHTGDGAVTAIDTRTNEVVGRVQIGDKAPGKDGKMRATLEVRYITLDPARQLMYLMGQGWNKENTLYVIDTRTMTITRTLDGFGMAKVPGMAIDTAGQRLFASSLGAELFVIDTEKMAITSRTRLRSEQAITMVYEPAGKRLLAVDQGAARMRYFQEQLGQDFKSTNPGGEIVALDSRTGQEIRHVPAAAGPLDLVLDEKGRRLFVTHRDAGKVSIYNSDTLDLLHVLDVPPMPNSLAFDAANDALYVTVKNDPGTTKMPNGEVAKVHPASVPALPEKLVRIALPR